LLEVLACPVPPYVKQLESTLSLCPLLHSPDSPGQSNSAGVKCQMS